jgi:hypothetical protein
MFWAICFVVFAILLSGIGYAMSRARRSGYTEGANHEALQHGAAKSYGRRMQSGGGGFSN